MDDSHNTSSQWELSKENIQPLKQGRNAAVLSVVLDDNAAQKLNISRHEFEEELRAYSGDDPLDVWYRYALWVEQNYPKGGKEGKLMKLIEKCVMTMYTTTDLREKYMNDPRFLDIWIKYASLSPKPLEVYQTMEAKELCLSLGDFYINWAWEMEKTGNYKRASAIYEKGLQAGAKPLSTLQEAQKKFQIRVARSTIEGTFVESESLASEPKRQALTSLKPQGRKVTSNRTGPALAGPAGRVHQDMPSGNTSGPAFSIFQDTTASVGSTRTRNDGAQGGSLGLGGSSEVENIRNPSQWTKAKVHQKTTSIVPVEDVEKYQKPKFSVHEDEDASQQMGPPTKLPQTSNVLSLRKEYEDWHVELFIQEPFDPKAQPQYCKHKVYCGTEEFSFEELRALQYTKKEKEKEQREAEFKQIRGMLEKQEEIMKKQEEMIQQLLNSKQDQTKQNNPAEVDLPPKVVVSSQPRVIKQKPRKGAAESSHSIYQDSWITINKSVNASINASNALDESTSALLLCQPATASMSSKESSVIQDPAPVSAINPQSCEHLNVSTSGVSRGLSLSDPTADTKAAMNIINDIWSTSLFHAESHQQKEGDSIGLAEPPPKDASAFTIFQDDSSKCQQLVKEERSLPFEIFSDSIRTDIQVLPQPSQVLQDREAAVESIESRPSEETEQQPEEQDENCPPPGMVQWPHERRHFSGILQPAIGIPIQTSEDQEQEQKTGDSDREGVEYKEREVMEGHNYVFSNKNDDLDDIVPLDGRQLEDFTLKMPNNSEIFANNAQISSTPLPWSLAHVSQAKVKSNSSIISTIKENNYFPLIQEDEDDDDKGSLQKSNNSGELMPPPAASQVLTFTNTTTAAKTTATATATFRALESKADLSPIMEASREYRSSTSSSSGSCTTSSTLYGHSVYGLSHHGNTTHVSRTRHHSNTDNEFVLEPADGQIGDFTKSGYLADKSKGESLAESVPSISRTQKPLFEEDQEMMCFSNAAAAMLRDFNDMIMPSTNNKKEECNTTQKVNPFDAQLLEQILSKLDEPVHMRGGFVAIRGNIPTIKINSEVTLGKETFHIFRVRGEGAYAKAYQAMTLDPLNVTVIPSDDEEEDDEQQIILKVQKPACPWEFYICHELRQRFKDRQYSQSILGSVMRINRGYFFSNGSVLANQFHKYGTLLDAINGCRAAGHTIPEEITMYFMVEVLTILEAVHNCDIIHADIKPDNFLIQNIADINQHAKSPEDIFGEGPAFLKLIDFGRSIDMRTFPAGTTFTEVVTTDKFTCCEMLERRPWTYQTDYYGAAGIAHLFLFGSYMEVKKTSGKWTIQSSFKRYWKKDLWQQVFSTLLNLHSSSIIPSVVELKKDMIAAFYLSGMHKDINKKFRHLQQLMSQSHK